MARAGDPEFLSARRQAALVRRRSIGCLELLDHYIARVETHDPRINAVVVRDFERARAAARKLDRSKAAPGPLHGVPMTVKESFDVAGLPTTWGIEAKRDNIAAADALAVARLKAAGAIVFGKTNVPVMLADWQSTNPVYGSTGNPWDLARSPGGSSGGGAAALCAGLTGLEIGSDIGGSIRQPAHACGLFGHKPTWGLIPPYGHSFMPGIAAMTDISVVGPLARAADDLALALDLLAIPDPAETGMAYSLPAPRTKSIAGLRIAVWAEDPATQTDDETTAALEALGRQLKREGARVGFAARPAFDAREAFHLYLQLLEAALSSRASPEDRERRAARAKTFADDDRSAAAVLARSGLIGHGDYLTLNERRHKMRRAWGAFFHDWDVLLCPAFSAPAQKRFDGATPGGWTAEINGAEIATAEMLFWPGLIGGFHLPSTAAPLGMTKSGLPIGVQIVGPLYGDRITISVAQMLERSWRAFEPPPGWD